MELESAEFQFSVHYLVSCCCKQLDSSCSEVNGVRGSIWFVCGRVASWVDPVAFVCFRLLFKDDKRNNKLLRANYRSFTNRKKRGPKHWPWARFPASSSWRVSCPKLTNYFSANCYSGQSVKLKHFHGQTLVAGTKKRITSMKHPEQYWTRLLGLPADFLEQNWQRCVLSA